MQNNYDHTVQQNLTNLITHNYPQECSFFYYFGTCDTKKGIYIYPKFVLRIDDLV